jgi:hypothetical protein
MPGRSEGEEIMVLASGVWMIVLAIVLGHAMSALNGMDQSTPHFARLGALAIAIGAFGMLVSPVFGRRDIEWEAAAIAIGLAVYCIAQKLRERPRARSGSTGRARP